MKNVLLAAFIALIPFPVLAQTRPLTSGQSSRSSVAAGDALATSTGHELNVSVGAYNYVEPGDLNISIHGPKFGGEYHGTLWLNRNQHTFAEINARGSIGQVTYDGWCAPFLITPNSASPNGYQLDLGDYSPCNESGDKDGYVEARGLVGRDFIGRRWGFSPAVGLGFRHLSNGITGVPGFRTDDYLYLPLALTLRTAVADHHVLAFNVEYDYLLRGWQETKDSALGGGVVPATATAPAFTIESFSDISFEQHDGWAFRASAKYQLTRRWSVEPSYIHWRVDASPVNFETVAFTVNNVTAQEQWGAYEPLNTTNEFVVKLGFHF